MSYKEMNIYFSGKKILFTGASPVPALGKYSLCALPSMEQNCFLLQEQRRAEKKRHCFLSTCDNAHCYAADIRSPMHIAALDEDLHKVSNLLTGYCVNNAEFWL